MQLLLLTLMKIRGWGLFPSLLRRVPHSQRKNDKKEEEEKNGWPFFVAAELGSGGETSFSE